jgi:HD-GYP domain-containing protein (c-di-GMP phosphodiesterase class II)
MVGALGRHERLTRGHTERVRAYADLIAQELGLSVHDRTMLHWASLVHDFGS